MFPMLVGVVLIMFYQVCLEKNIMKNIQDALIYVNIQDAMLFK